MKISIFFVAINPLEYNVYITNNLNSIKLHNWVNNKYKEDISIDYLYCITLRSQRVTDYNFWVYKDNYEDCWERYYPFKINNLKL